MIGTRLLERYELTSELGRGGMGVVYRAHDPVLDREVAVKVIPEERLNPETEERFQREARLVAAMDHPAIVPIHDFGRHGGALFFVMPWVQGRPLRQDVQRGDLEFGEVLDIAVQVAEALDYSHARGVIHRDVKPDNVMVVHDGGRPRVRVMDFGLAQGTSTDRLTASGGLLGTLTYLSPEQVASAELDGRSDIYSLGTVLYECLSGRPPFEGTLYSLLYRISNEVPQSLRERGVRIAEELDRLVLRCLATARAPPPPGRRTGRARGVRDARSVGARSDRP
jgi:serine/threonine-protein kinase